MKKKEFSKEELYVKARKKVGKLKVFYIHLCGYLVLVILLVYNLIIIEEGEYKNAIIWLNCTTIVVWGIFVIIHAWTTFKGRFLFSKSWEERKIREFMKDQEEEKVWE